MKSGESPLNLESCPSLLYSTNTWIRMSFYGVIQVVSDYTPIAGSDGSLFAVNLLNNGNSDETTKRDSRTPPNSNCQHKRTANSRINTNSTSLLLI